MFVEVGFRHGPQILEYPRAETRWDSFFLHIKWTGSQCGVDRVSLTCAVLRDPAQASSPAWPSVSRYRHHTLPRAGRGQGRQQGCPSLFFRGLGEAAGTWLLTSQWPRRNPGTAPQTTASLGNAILISKTLCSAKTMEAGFQFATKHKGCRGSARAVSVRTATGRRLPDSPRARRQARGQTTVSVTFGKQRVGLGGVTEPFLWVFLFRPLLNSGAASDF